MLKLAQHFQQNFVYEAHDMSANANFVYNAHREQFPALQAQGSSRLKLIELRFF